MRQSLKAFTLIELLVVIAIIAILAAILFPVFAQAKAAAKGSVCISNLKQTTLGILMYTNDFDDEFPMASIDFNGGWDGTGFVGWQFPCGTTPTIEQDCYAEGNSTQPYMKNSGILECPSVPAGNYNLYGNPPGTPDTSYTFNGDIEDYSTTGVASPTLTVVMWSGSLDTSYDGRTISAPTLNCPDGTQACTYVPNPDGTLKTNGASDVISVYDYPGSPYVLPNYSKWIHNNGDNMSNVDGHAKYHHLMGGIKEDPWAYTGPQGQAEQGVGSDVFPVFTNATGGHECLFAPDNPCGL